MFLEVILTHFVLSHSWFLWLSASIFLSCLSRFLSPYFFGFIPPPCLVSLSFPPCLSRFLSLSFSFPTISLSFPLHVCLTFFHPHYFPLCLSLIFSLSVAFLFSFSFSSVGLNFSIPSHSHFPYLSVSLSFALSIFLFCLSHSCFLPVCLILASLPSFLSVYLPVFSFPSHCLFPVNFHLSLPPVSLFLPFFFPLCSSYSRFLSLSISHSFSLTLSLPVSLPFYLLVFLPLCPSHSRSLPLSFPSLSLWLCRPHWAHH